MRRFPKVTCAMFRLRSIHRPARQYQFVSILFLSTRPTTEY